jgi:hypothetical protein
VGGGEGDGGVDGDLVGVLLVDQLQVQSLEQLSLQPLGSVGEDPGQGGQAVQQGGIFKERGNLGEGGQLLVDGSAVGFQFAKPLNDPRAERGDGG